MKKIISVIALVLAMTMLMSVSAFAAKSFSVAEDAVIPEGVTVTPAADSIAVSVPATNGADYSVLLVSGNTLPTTDSVIAYINQDKPVAVEGEEDAYEVAFNVLPLMSVADNAADGALTLYVGTNATGEGLITVPVTYAEPAPTGCNVTLMNGTATVAATLATDADGNVTLPADTAFNGSNLVSGYNLTLYSWVTVTSTNDKGYPVEGEEYLAGAKVAAADLEGKTLYAKYLCDRLIGDVDASGAVNGTDVTAVKYNYLNKLASLQKKAGQKLYDGSYIVIGDVDANGAINGTDVTAVKYNYLNKLASLQKNAGKKMYVINK